MNSDAKHGEIDCGLLESQVIVAFSDSCSRSLPQKPRRECTDLDSS